MGRQLTGGDVVALNGDLGSGKTCLTQGIAKGLDVPKGYIVTSPSFALVNEYPGRIRLFHMDFYRIGDVSELDEIGFDDMIAVGGVVVIEWAYKFLSALPKERLDLSMTIVNDRKRELSLRGHGQRGMELAKICSSYFQLGNLVN